MADDAARDDSGDVDYSRRAFVKKGLVAGFAAPVIVSFALDGVAEAHEKHHHRHPNQIFNNQGEDDDDDDFLFLFRFLRFLRFR